jgi:hypothetical protein
MHAERSRRARHLDANRAEPDDAHALAVVKMAPPVSKFVERPLVSH